METAVIPQWAYMVAAGALLTIGQRLMASVIETFEKRVVKLEDGAEKEQTERRDRDHGIIKDLQGAMIRISMIEQQCAATSAAVARLESHHDRTK